MKRSNIFADFTKRQLSSLSDVANVLRWSTKPSSPSRDALTANHLPGTTESALLTSTDHRTLREAPTTRPSGARLRAPTETLASSVPSSPRTCPQLPWVATLSAWCFTPTRPSELLLLNEQKVLGCSSSPSTLNQLGR